MNAEEAIPYDRQQSGKQRVSSCRHLKSRVGREQKNGSEEGRLRQGRKDIKPNKLARWVSGVRKIWGT